jgi:hypothetical protein
MCYDTQKVRRIPLTMLLTVESSHLSFNAEQNAMVSINVLTLIAVISNHEVSKTKTVKYVLKN